MKTVFLILGLFISFSSYAQDYTEKYNSTLSRYEYFDSSGNLIGYRSYNRTLGRWEYHSNSSGQAGGTIQYQNITSPYNMSLIEQAMRAKQEQYYRDKAELERRASIIYDVTGNIAAELELLKDNGLRLTEDQFKWLKKVDKKIKTLKYEDFYDNQYQNTVNWLNSLPKIIRRWRIEALTQQETPNSNAAQGMRALNSKKNNKSKKKHIFGDYAVYESAPVREDYSAQSKQIGTTSSIVKILEKSNDDYFKVELNNGVIGYLHKVWIKE